MYRTRSPPRPSWNPQAAAKSQCWQARSWGPWATGSEESQTGKTLVVYYSASGHTRQVAQAIAQAAELNKGV